MEKEYKKALYKGFKKRLGMAARGGLFLLGPMWLMVLVHSWLYTSLIATTAFVASESRILLVVSGVDEDLYSVATLTLPPKPRVPCY